MLEIWIGLIFTAIVVIAILYVISIWIYKRAPANTGFIRTGWRGTKVCLGRGAIVLPVFHEVSWISLETMKLVVTRSREQAVLTADKIRIDVVAEMYTHVGHTEDAVLVAAAVLSLTYSHYAFSRADVDHLWQGAAPMVVGVLAVVGRSWSAGLLTPPSRILYTRCSSHGLCWYEPSAANHYLLGLGRLANRDANGALAALKRATELEPRNPKYAQTYHNVRKGADSR